MSNIDRGDISSADLNLLVVFDAIMREGSISAAAQVLHRYPHLKVVPLRGLPMMKIGRSILRVPISG